MDKSVMVYVISCVIAYFIGAIPFGYIIGKMRGVDVRTVGSKNIGATNVYRTVGKKWGLLAFACDCMKGMLPTIAAKCLFAEFNAAALPLPLMVGLMTVVGHMFTCFMKFKGGKGIATAFGMLVALYPVLLLITLALFIVTVWISHYISLGSILAAAFLMVMVWIPIPHVNPIGYHNIIQCILVTFVGAFAIWKHRTNIARLRAGNENKIY